MKPSILLVDDEEAIRLAYTRFLSKGGYAIQAASSLEEARSAMGSSRFDAILLDLSLPDGNGLEWIPDLRESHPGLAIIVITGVGGLPAAVEAMRGGADNFLQKPVNMKDLDIYLRKCLELGDLRRKQITRDRTKKKTRLYFGNSRVMEEVADASRIAASNDSAVLLQGETGTGKGRLARWIHEHGEQSDAPFIEVNCSALRGELLASELFGHAKGAFTSAVQDKRGLIEVADGGTLFLDEIGDMDLEVQSQFLKVIEEKHYRRVGDVGDRRSEFRLICATNRDLQAEIKQGRFRSELYYRVHVFPITLPPLQKRHEDLPGLIQHILEEKGAAGKTLDAEAITLLQQYRWPGNTRELSNVLERAVLLAGEEALAPMHFPGLDLSGMARDPSGLVMNLDKLEELAIRKALEKLSGDTKKAAGTLGISRATLYRKIKQYSIKV